MTCAECLQEQELLERCAGCEKTFCGKHLFVSMDGTWDGLLCSGCADMAEAG